MEIKSLFVVSSPQTIDIAGVIAQTVACGGHNVILLCEDQPGCERAQQGIERQLDAKAASGELTIAQAAEAQARVAATTDLGDARDCDVVIESVTEDKDLKQRALLELDQICQPKTIFATNTSSLTITGLAAATGRPDRVIGMHFIYFSPVMKVAEIARGRLTSDETFSAVENLAKGLGLEVALSEDAPGLLSTRIWMIHVNEAANNVFTKLVEPEALKKLNRTISPNAYSVLESADFIGLDNCVAWLENLYLAYGDTKYCPSPLLVQMVDAGQLGVKTGRGFFNYT